MLSLVSVLFGLLGVYLIEEFRTVFEVNFTGLTLEVLEAAKSIIYYLRLFVLVLWPVLATYALDDLLEFIYAKLANLKRS